MRTLEFRLYPHKAQRALLMQCLIGSRHLYNEMLETLKAQYEDKGTFPGKYELTARFKGRGGEHAPATTVQCLADRLSKALKRFLAAKALGLPNVGFPRFKKPTSQKTLRRKQRQLSRRKKGSHRRRKAAQNTAKTHLKIARQRRDFHCKVARQYGEHYHRIVVEDLAICNMVKNHHLAKSIMDASWGAFLAILEATLHQPEMQPVWRNRTKISVCAYP